MGLSPMVKIYVTGNTRKCFGAFFFVKVILLTVEPNAVEISLIQVCITLSP